MTQRLKVLSLLGVDVEGQLGDRLVELGLYEYQKLPFPKEQLGADDLTREGFWDRFQNAAVDILLVPVSSEVALGLDRWTASRSQRSSTGVGLWTRQPAAVVAVVDSGSWRETVHVAQLHFDGILPWPMESRGLHETMQRALRERATRICQRRRGDRLRYMCRRLNHARRRLRAKVDLLCRDLVAANRDLIGTARQLSCAFASHNSLASQSDLQSILQRVLEQTTKEAAAPAGAIYVCANERFQTHTNWRCHQHQVAWSHAENILQETIVWHVKHSGRAVLVADRSGKRAVPFGFPRQFAGLSLMGLPIAVGNSLVGVLVLGRSVTESFSWQDVLSISAVLASSGWVLGMQNRRCQEK